MGDFGAGLTRLLTVLVMSRRGGSDNAHVVRARRLNCVVFQLYHVYMRNVGGAP